MRLAIPPPRSWIIERLGTPRAKRFALLDSTRDAQLNAWLPCLPAEIARCLWPAPLAQGLANYAPFVLDLERCPGFLERWSDAGIDAHWGLLVEAEAGLEQVQRHFMPFTHIRQGGRTQLCRFYDPRVFPRLLNVFSPGQKRSLLPGWVKCLHWTDIDAQARLRLRSLHNHGHGLFSLRLSPYTLEDSHAEDP